MNVNIFFCSPLALRLPRAVFVRSQKVRIFPKLFISLDGVIFHNISARLGQHFYSRWHFVISICFNEIRVHPMDFNDSNNEHHHNERKTKFLVCVTVLKINTRLGQTYAKYIIKCFLFLFQSIFIFSVLIPPQIFKSARND